MLLENIMKKSDILEQKLCKSRSLLPPLMISDHLEKPRTAIKAPSYNKPILPPCAGRLIPRASGPDQNPEAKFIDIGLSL